MSLVLQQVGRSGGGGEGGRTENRTTCYFWNLAPRKKKKACLIFIYPPVADWWGNLWKSIHYDNEQIVIHWALSPFDSDSYQRERSRQRLNVCVCVCGGQIVAVPEQWPSLENKPPGRRRLSCHSLALKCCHSWLIRAALLFILCVCVFVFTTHIFVSFDKIYNVCVHFCLVLNLIVESLPAGKTVKLFKHTHQFQNQFIEGHCNRG